MIFAPHTLHVKVFGEPTKDSIGREIPFSATERLVYVCRCRCDDDNTGEMESDNGHTFTPTYHVVCEKSVDLKEDDEVQCMIGDIVRGEGKVKRVKRTNYFGYTEIWLGL